MQGLISERTNDAINKIVEKAFNGNALFDNIHYNLDVIFNMTIAHNIVHNKIAHWLPAPFADNIQDFQLRRNIKPIRPMVEAQTKTYDSYIDCFADALTYFQELETIFKDAIKIADEEVDIESRIFLENTYLDILPFTKQMIIWYGKAIEYNESVGAQLFDAHFESFTIL